jgi:hypothetical protein
MERQAGVQMPEPAFFLLTLEMAGRPGCKRDSSKLKAKIQVGRYD